MIIFIDIETTGLEEIDKVCSIGLIAVDADKVHVEYELVNEGKKISPKASSVNHITNEMLKGKESLKGTKAYKFLQEHNNEETVIVAHNIKYDMKMLNSAGFRFKGKGIDTLRCTKHLIPECEQFSLQFLRYELRLYKQEQEEASVYNIKIKPHNAISDALHVKMLYEYLLDISTDNELIELSNKHVLIQKFEFGKYSGKYIEEIAMNDRAYLEWMLNNISDLDEDLRYSVEYYIS